MDYDLYKMWREHVRLGLERNDQMFRKLLNAFMRPYQLIVWMNIILFTVGIVSFVTAIIMSVTQEQPLYAAIFAGLSAATFIGFFISRPMRALEENLEFITWLGMITTPIGRGWSMRWISRPCNRTCPVRSRNRRTRLIGSSQRHAELAGRRPGNEVGA